MGIALGQTLHALGHQVWGLKRHPADLPSTLNPLAADLTDPTTLGQLPTALDSVVYSAAATGFNEPAYRAAYVSGVDHLLQALRANGQPLQRLLFVSSTSVYTQHQGEWVDEDTPCLLYTSRCV